MLNSAVVLFAVLVWNPDNICSSFALFLHRFGIGCTAGWDFLLFYLLTMKAIISSTEDLFWHTTVWSLWLLRNALIFKDCTIDFLSITELIRQRSWFWFIAESGNSNYSFTDWIVCQVGCINWFHKMLLDGYYGAW